MSAPAKHKFTTPVGRIVGGSLYDPRTTDYEGNPLTVKSGANAGQPRKDFGFAVAFPKTPGAAHWANEAWLKPLWDLAHAAFPNGEAQRPDFAWKITDGDSTVPKKGKNGQPGRKPCEQEGYRGHWVLWFSGGQAPNVWNANGTQQITEKDAVKPGYYVQVFGNAADNKPSASPGLYLNHSMVAFAGYGNEISFGPDVSQAGFGNAALPPGASATPLAGAFNPGAMPPLPPGAPAVPGAAVGYAPAAGAMVPPPMVSAPAAAPVLVAVPGAAYSIEQCRTGGWTDDQIVQAGYATRQVVPAPLPPAGSVPTGLPPVPGAPAAMNVTPNPAFTAVPGMPAAPIVPPPPGAAPVPAAPPARQMTAKASGATYEQLISAGWNDATLVQHGMMTL